MIFGSGNIVNAASCFGKYAYRNTENLVWHLRVVVMRSEKINPSTMRDLGRGENLLKLVRKRKKPQRKRKQNV